DLNNSSSLTIANYLLEKDPLRAGTDANQRYSAQAQAIVNYRDKVKGGVLSSIDELKSVADPAVVSVLQDGFYVSDFAVRNVELMRREKLAAIVNRCINQTLCRIILTAGLTFLTVLALYLFGGEVLHGFSFALVIGILIGTYSSIAIAAPILVAYQDWRSTR